MPPELQNKLQTLQNFLRKRESVAVAFSGGVDSTFLLKVAHDVLGEKAVAITAHSEFFTEREMQETKLFCTKEKNPANLLSFQSPPCGRRCRKSKKSGYLCKRHLFSEFQRIAASNFLSAVCEGSNVDDLQDFRPGLKAIEELRIESPLREAKLSKKDIRELSKELGLSTWNKPSFACLASRFVYGERITERRLEMVSSTEQFLFQLGFKQYRVRIHGSDGNELARIEVLPEDFEKLFQHKAAIFRECKQAGFAYISLDLEGFRSGSMNVENSFST